LFKTTEKLMLEMLT